MKSLRIAASAVLAAVSLLAAGAPAHADDYLAIPDASVVKYAVAPSGGKVFFRNLNEIAPSWHGCCEYYWIDITTDNGRAQFSAFLSAKMARGRLVLSVPAAGSPSAILLLGDL